MENTKPLPLIFNELRAAGKVKNQAEFGEKLGYKPSFTSRLLTGKEPEPKDLRNKLSDVYDLHADYFRTEPDTKKPDELAGLNSDLVRELIEVSKSQRDMAIEIGLKAAERAVEKMAEAFATKKEIQANLDAINERLAEGAILMRGLQEYTQTRFAAVGNTSLYQEVEILGNIMERLTPPKPKSKRKALNN
jgi:transcriptional regulator with XRE-family HTH domain